MIAVALTNEGYLDLWGADGHHPDAPRSGFVGSGTTVTWTVPAGTLHPSVVYGYDARSIAQGGWGPWTSPRCYIVADTTPPDEQPTVGSTDYPEDRDRFFGSIGRSGQFTFGSNGVTDVTDFVYGTQNPPDSWVSANAGGTATVIVTPVARGPNTTIPPRASSRCRLTLPANPD